MTQADALHVFHQGDDGWWVVARDPEDAWDVALVGFGGDRADYESDSVFEQWPDDRPLTILCNAEGHPDESGEHVTRPCGEWAAREGRGILCSRDY
jgi:hypothetical protein